VTLFNTAAERLTGLSANDARLSSLSVVPWEIADLLHGTLYDAQPRTQIEITIDPAPGDATSLLCSTSPLRDKNGTMLGAVAVFSDLTRLKTLETEKQQAERLASVGALASGIAHEIKNPLVAIKTFAELLPERFSEEDFRNDFSKVMITEIDRIDDLIARLRGLATASTHSVVALDIRIPIEETLALLRGQFEQARITTSLDVHKSPPLIAGDFSQLKQLFLNIFINSIEAMDPGGHISIGVGVGGSRNDQTVHVDITDAGCGIPDSVRGRIFDPFVTTKPRGSGLGLSICRGIVDAHKGAIRAHNNERGHGATVSVEFPALQDPPAQVSVTF
jgi:signal transduction histidine kinase